MLDFFTKLLTPLFIGLGLVNPTPEIPQNLSNIETQTIQDINQDNPQQEIFELQERIKELENQGKKDVKNAQIPASITAQSSLENTLPSVSTPSNLDSTCLSFYSKMQALDILPIKENPIYTPEEHKAIEMSYQGEYNPILQRVFTKKETVENQYLNELRDNSAQKQSLTSKFSFCYEYLAKTYGFIINE